MPLTFKQQLTIALINNAVMGALLLVAGFGFNRMLEGFKSQQQQAHEALRSDLARAMEVARERRVAIAELAKSLASGYHAMELLTWKARYNPQAFSKADVAGYNSAIEVLYPQIASARVAASAIDSPRREAFKSLVTQLYALDNKLTKVTSDFEAAETGGDASELARAVKAIGDMHEQITHDDDAFIDQIAELAGSPSDRATDSPPGRAPD